MTVIEPVRFAVVGLGAFGEAYLASLRGPSAAAGVDLFCETRVEDIVGSVLREQLVYSLSRVPLAEARHALEVALALIRSAEEDREWLVETSSTN